MYNVCKQVMYMKNALYINYYIFPITRIYMTPPPHYSYVKTGTVSTVVHLSNHAEMGKTHYYDTFVSWLKT